jgi:hypothetical protein
MQRIKENTMLDPIYHAKMEIEAKKLGHSKSRMIALIVEKYFNNQKINLIPITEKRLLKCGFVKDGFSLTFNEFSFYNENLENLYIDLDQGQNLSGICVKVKYLHEIQNLCKSLTGIELQFKL